MRSLFRLNRFYVFESYLSKLKDLFFAEFLSSRQDLWKITKELSFPGSQWLKSQQGFYLVKNRQRLLELLSLPIPSLITSETFPSYSSYAISSSTFCAHRSRVYNPETCR